MVVFVSVKTERDKQGRGGKRGRKPTVKRSTRTRRQREETTSPTPSTSSDLRFSRERSSSIDSKVLFASPSRIPTPAGSARQETTMANPPLVTPDMLAQSLTMLERMQSDEIDELAISIEDMQYQGFTPKQFLAHMWAKGKAAGIDQETYMRAVKSMAYLGLIRGSRLKKLQSGGNVNLQRALSDWIRLYGLKDGKPDGPYVVTLVRVASSLAMMLSKGLQAGIVGLQGTISADGVCAGFPKGITLSNFGALIPTTVDPESVSLLTRAFYYYQYKFDRTFNADVTKKSNKENIVKYANIQVNSDLYSQEQRVAHCRAIGLIECRRGDETHPNS